MRISDWSSDVCSSDLPQPARLWALSATGQLLRLCACPQERTADAAQKESQPRAPVQNAYPGLGGRHIARAAPRARHLGRGRKSVGEGKSVSVRVDLGGRRIIKQKIKNITNKNR